MNQEDISQLASHQSPESQNQETQVPDFNLSELHEEKKLHELEGSSFEEHTTGSTPRFEKLLETIRALTDAETKLQTCIQFMEEAIAQSGVPHFKEFWEARRICLDLFKENISPSVRMTVWAKYSELCRQARRLKDIFNEQSAFACEQIEMAVATIEKEVDAIPEWLQKMAPVELSIRSVTIEQHLDRYVSLQSELNLLNAYATRTNALRKELIKTEMRIRQKNKFFERLSALGDKIFPKRKQLIQEVSALFTTDVDQFIQTTFVNELKTAALFDVREEIKALQACAKELTLNTEAFSQTRKSLSECWDSIKLVVKERRKISSEQKTLFKQHRDELVKELEELKTAVESGSLALIDGEKRLYNLIANMRKVALGKQEIHELRDKIGSLRDLITSKSHEVETEKRQKVQEEVQKREQEGRARFEKIKDSLEELIATAEASDVEIMSQSVGQLSRELTHAEFTKAQKQQLEKIVRRVHDVIEDKKDRKLLALSGTDRESLAELKTVLRERKARRQEIKTQIDAWRKAQKVSGLDFTSAFQFDERIEVERDRLEKIEEGIIEIEEEIAQLQQQAKGNENQADEDHSI